MAIPGTDGALPEGRGTEPVVVVDAANVVGSRPDGWWRDRAGAATRLIDRCQRAVRSGALTAPVLVVLEGQARAACPDPERPAAHRPPEHPFGPVDAPERPDLDDHDPDDPDDDRSRPTPPVGSGPGDSWFAGIVVARARADGDALIVTRVVDIVAAGRSALVVTADRELRDRVRNAGGDVAGPGWLLDRLP